jgi:hypothetical protein
MTVPFLSLGSDTVSISAASFSPAIANASALPADTRRESVSHHRSAQLALAPQDDDPHVVCASKTRRKETTVPPGRVAESRHLNFSPGPFYGPCTAPVSCNAGHFLSQGPCTAPAGDLAILASSWHGCRREIDRVDDVF